MNLQDVKLAIKIYSLVIFSALALSSCGEGSSIDDITTSNNTGGGTTTVNTFDVTIVSSGNGSIDVNSSITVNENDTTSLTLTADAAHVIGSVSGCNGSLTNTTYTTGAITADCTINVSFDAPTLTTVSAQFPANGAKWNDYVSGIDYITISDTACDVDNDKDCLHGGEYRVTELTGISSCSDLTASDTLAAFDWVCDDSNGTAQFKSTGLKDGKGLSDLIDFDATSFKNNSVIVSYLGNPLVTGSAGVWWTNSVVNSNTGGSLTGVSTIHILTSSHNVDYSLDNEKMALIVKPGITVGNTSSVASSLVNVASTSDHSWIEGEFISYSSRGISIEQAKFSRINLVTVMNATSSGVHIGNSRGNEISHVDVHSSGDGLTLRLSDFNRVKNFYASNNTSGIVIDRSYQNYLSNFNNNNSGHSGINLSNNADNNVFSQMTISSNDNTTGGILFNNGSENNVIANTTSNHNDEGIRIQVGSHNNSVLGAVAANNTEFGMRISTDGNKIKDTVMANNSSVGFSIGNSSNNKFTGLLQVGNNGGGIDCLVNGGTDPGLVNNTCAQQGASDFGTPITGTNLTFSFVQKVFTDDSVNTDDTNGTSNFPTVINFNFNKFENEFRNWGKDGSPFPNADTQKRWTTSTGRIWDWSIVTGENGNAGTPALRNVLTLPDGNDTLSHTWKVNPAINNNSGCDAEIPNSVYVSNGGVDFSQVCTTHHLEHAVEIMGDHIGNENLLCESGETCLYTPNIGSYQGHGNIVSAGTFVDGTLTGITLLKYETNGR